MTVSRKILIGFSVLVLLMVSGIGYELFVIYRLQEINNRLSDVSFRSGERATRLGENLRDVAEFTEKHLLNGDPIYAAQLATSRASFEDGTALMLESVRSESERGAVRQLSSTWEAFQEALAEVQADRPAGEHDFLPVRLEEQLRQMRIQIDAIVTETRRGVASEVVLSSEAGRRAQGISWVVALTAVALAGGIVFSMTRSIRSSFQTFMGATSAVAEGEFDKRLPENREDEFGELARSFNTMAERLDELDRLKRDFVSSVSHELKSPIASSREIVQVLLDEVPGRINDEQRRLLELSIRSSRRLSAMVGGLLDLARMDAGTMRYELLRCDMKELVSSTIEEFEVVAAERGLRIEARLDDVDPVLCDRDRIVQVVGNLLDNAMKFSTRGSLISVRLENIDDGGDGPSGSGVMFSILDQGPGVADGDKKRIFTRFQQVSPKGAPQGGVGLGLAICRSIVEGHGGRIWVEDNPRGGAVFRFAIPATPKDPPGSSAQ